MTPPTEAKKRERMREDPPMKGLRPEHLRSIYLEKDCVSDADCTEDGRNTGLICHDDAEICIDKTDTSYDDEDDEDEQGQMTPILTPGIPKLMRSKKKRHNAMSGWKSKCRGLSNKKSSCKKKKQCFFLLIAVGFEFSEVRA